MTHQQALIVASILSGRVDVNDLTFEQRSMVGIRIEPLDRESRADALKVIEKALVAHLEKRTDTE